MYIYIRIQNRAECDAITYKIYVFYFWKMWIDLSSIHISVLTHRSIDRNKLAVQRHPIACHLLLFCKLVWSEYWILWNTDIQHESPLNVSLSMVWSWNGHQSETTEVWIPMANCNVATKNDSAESRYEVHNVIHWIISVSIFISHMQHHSHKHLYMLR